MDTRPYLYTGPLTGVTLQDGESKHELMLYPNTVVELPPEHAYVKGLLALGHLKNPPTKAAPKVPSAKPETKEAETQAKKGSK